MLTSEMMHKVENAPGFVAALDQSGGSTPGALEAYGVDRSTFGSEAAMFDLIHAMRERIILTPAFRGDRIIGAILFEGTMDRAIAGVPAPSFLWEQRGVVPFVKVDQGLEAERAGVQLMKPTPGLEDLLRHAWSLNVFGTKMRSVIRLADQEGIDAVVDQQFDLALLIARAGLVPIVEPEVLIASPVKADAETCLRDALLRRLDRLDADTRIMLKLTIPVTPDLYRDLMAHDRVVRVLALSGGYDRSTACDRLALNHGMIASFSRALIGDLREAMADEEFDSVFAAAVRQIYQASIV